VGGVDGDTITIATRLMQFSGDTIFKFPVRLSGIDTPELRTKNDDERKAALIVRDALADLILQKDVTLSHVTYDKYGRLLADVRFGEIHLSHWLIENRFAVEYFGKTKMSPQSWTAFMSG
jgi:micrococcal nuclease